MIAMSIPINKIKIKFPFHSHASFFLILKKFFVGVKFTNDCWLFFDPYLSVKHRSQDFQEQSGRCPTPGGTRDWVLNFSEQIDPVVQPTDAV